MVNERRLFGAAIVVEILFCFLKGCVVEMGIASQSLAMTGVGETKNKKDWNGKRGDTGCVDSGIARWQPHKK